MQATTQRAVRPGLIDVRRTLETHEILLTGASGFVGKVILGLLLDRYPELRRVHVILRPGRGRGARERFKRDVLGSPALAGIVSRLGERFIAEKVAVWEGDIGRPGFEPTPEQHEAWQGRLGLIIHCAGLVEFAPPVDESLAANVDSVENMLALAAHTGAKLLHVSTCYVAGRADGLVEETEPVLGFYPRRRGPDDATFDHTAELSQMREQVLKILAARSGSDDVRELGQRLTELGLRRAERWGWVNTYTYTKSLAEQLIAANSAVDWAIVRPAIVESALRFPFPGWVEGGRTAAPLVLMALGGLRHWPVRPDIPLEVVPVDLAASAIVTAGALLLHGENARVYQLGSQDVNPYELGRLVKLLHREAERAGAGGNGTFRLALFPRLQFVTEEQARRRRAAQQRRVDRAHAWLARAELLLERGGLPGKSAVARWKGALRALGLQALFREQTIDQYLPFVLHNRYIFEAENIRRAGRRLTKEDRRRLPWDPEHIDWECYWTLNQIGGIRRWVQPEAVREWSFKL